jgi:hypothetical protein
MATRTWPGGGAVDATVVGRVLVVLETRGRELPEHCEVAKAIKTMTEMPTATVRARRSCRRLRRAAPIPLYGVATDFNRR